jgi:hypothetical protein
MLLDSISLGRGEDLFEIIANQFHERLAAKFSGPRHLPSVVHQGRLPTSGLVSLLPGMLQTYCDRHLAAPTAGSESFRKLLRRMRILTHLRQGHMHAFSPAYVDIVDSTFAFSKLRVWQNRSLSGP